MTMMPMTCKTSLMTAKVLFPVGKLAARKPDHDDAERPEKIRRRRRRGSNEEPTEEELDEKARST